MFLFYTLLVVSWFFVKLFWGKTVGKIFGYFNAVIGIFAFIPLLQDEGRGFNSLGMLISVVYAFLFVAIFFISFIIVAFIKADFSNISLENILLDNSRSSGSSKQEYGNYVIQYRRGGSWIDGPGSNDERTAESMFDQFLNNDPRAENRCRLVYKVNGRVKSVLGSN